MPRAQLSYSSSEDDGMDEATLVLRRSKEIASVEGLKKKIANLSSKEAVARFVLLGHDAYKAHGRTVTTSPDKFEKSY